MRLEPETYLDRGEVELIVEPMSDLRVVNAARVSNAKRHDEFDTEKDAGLLRYLVRNRHWTPFGHVRFGADVKLCTSRVEDFIDWSGDEAASAGWTWRIERVRGDLELDLRGSLWGWFMSPPPISPFELESIQGAIQGKCPHSVQAFDWERQYDEANGDICADDSFTFRIALPLFVARQLMRSNVGVVYNETSRRYVDHEPAFYEPDPWRRRPEKGIKQGSGEPISICEFPRVIDPGHREIIGAVNRHHLDDSKALYQDLIDGDVAPELARSVLPQAMMTELWVTFTEPALRRVLGLRLGGDEKNHPQFEIVELSRAIRRAVRREIGGREYDRRFP